MTSRKQNSGFTLIELVVVIIILGILAVVALPKFINLGDDADRAIVKGTAGTLKEGVNLAHAAWVAKGASGSMENVEIYGNDYEHSIDFNKYGWPAQHYFYDDVAGTHLDNKDDCVSVWQQIMQKPGPTVSTDKQQNTDYHATFVDPSNTQKDEHPDGSCIYRYNKQPKYSITYDSITGHVSTNFETPAK